VLHQVREALLGAVSHPAYQKPCEDTLPKSQQNASFWTTTHDIFLCQTGRGVRVIAKQFGVNPGTVQRISRPFEQDAVTL
jgi:hypothetical protein